MSKANTKNVAFKNGGKKMRRKFSSVWSNEDNEHLIESENHFSFGVQIEM